jgi:hypothetical protein
VDRYGTVDEVTWDHTFDVACPTSGGSQITVAQDECFNLGGIPMSYIGVNTPIDSTSGLAMLVYTDENCASLDTSQVTSCCTTCLGPISGSCLSAKITAATVVQTLLFSLIL